MRTYQSRTLLGILNDISLPCASVYFQIAPKDRYNHAKALHFHRPIFPQLSHFPFSILAVITSSRNIYSLQGALPPLFTRRPLYFDISGVKSQISSLQFLENDFLGTDCNFEEVIWGSFCLNYLDLGNS